MPGSSDINSNEENSVKNYDIESDSSEEVEMPIEDYKSIESDPSEEVEIPIEDYESIESDPSEEIEMPIEDYESEPELDPEPESEEVVPIYNPLEVIVIESDTEDESMEGNTEESTKDVGATFEGWDVRNGLQIGSFVYVRLHPLGGCAWKAESWVGTYIGPVQILRQKTPWVQNTQGELTKQNTREITRMVDVWNLALEEHIMLTFNRICRLFLKRLVYSVAS
ncbi:unnamed protein product [Camellia sinensis]